MTCSIDSLAIMILVLTDYFPRLQSVIQYDVTGGGGNPAFRVIIKAKVGLVSLAREVNESRGRETPKIIPGPLG